MGLPDLPGAPPAEQKPPDDDLTFWDRTTKFAGYIGHGLAKAPDVIVKVVPGLLRFAVVDALVPLVQFAAAVGGVVAFVGLGASGALEIIAGTRQHDSVKVLTGAGDLSRGLFLGTVAEAAVSHLPFERHLIGAWGRGFSVATGVFAVASGSLKCDRGDTAEKPHQRLEGILEIGIGICSLVAAQGTLLYPAIALQAGLAVARLAVTKQEKLKAIGSTVADRARQSWNHLRDVFSQDWAMMLMSRFRSQRFTTHGHASIA